MGHSERFDELAREVQRRLAAPKSKRSKPVIVDFDAAYKAGRAPGEANSEFLINRAMGDWAETRLQQALAGSVEGLRVVKYGNSDQIVAGDPGFRDFYSNYQKELATIGKRPDLLVFGEDNYDERWGDDISSLPPERLREIVPAARFSIEVRSSKFLADKYARVRREQVGAGARVSQEEQSFTVKVEDLTLVKRWVETFNVPHFYAQVFLDSAYLIPTEKILSLVAEGAKGVSVKINRRNQNKPTIHVPLSYGTRIADIERPTFDRVRERETSLGRVDPYVEPTGGETRINVEALLSTLNGEAPEAEGRAAAPSRLF